MSTKRRDKMEQAQTSHKIIEKRRRDRINNCLAELSQAVPPAFASKTSGKLEKAEILEMTVHYLRVLHAYGIRLDSPADQPIMLHNSPEVQYEMLHQHYRNGYSDCIREILQYFIDVEGTSPQDQRCNQIFSYLQARINKGLHQSYDESSASYHRGQSNVSNGGNASNNANSISNSNHNNNPNGNLNGKDRRNKPSTQAFLRSHLNANTKSNRETMHSTPSPADVNNAGLPNLPLQLQQASVYPNVYQNHGGIQYGMHMPTSTSTGLLQNACCLPSSHPSSISKAVNDQSNSLLHGSM
ncbi:uncharacterized protein TRIADDRAFT_59292 [Trichoplax adhaerens]|uniref:Hairy and enhancer of split-related protein HELT n=1 Tax=Trichoplax adhaerens TaxID=10228 RepID=B3S5D9_TRIAD|nr:hypothetical protein TRIADDRAFT_59292 [Trichoplax adhaerens]EDV22120.1 hypothetical protein TRIADDRAFT_59292 [Trichoplax adhaerens]|eukprot:XP_002115275.1 hypothetical protein TRIADDRAFT_59292 [Trichoplax adhaerens]